MSFKQIMKRHSLANSGIIF